MSPLMLLKAQSMDVRSKVTLSKGKAGRGCQVLKGQEMGKVVHLLGQQHRCTLLLTVCDWRGQTR